MSRFLCVAVIWVVFVFFDLVVVFLHGWLYLGRLGNDKLPIGVAKLPPEGVNVVRSTQALHKALDVIPKLI